MAIAKGCAWAIVSPLMWGMACVCHGAAPVGAPTPTVDSPTVDCTTVLLNLVDCLSFVEEGSKVGSPEGKRCHGLQEVVKENMACLCEPFNGRNEFGWDLNVSKALTLPHACGVTTPPLSGCHSPSSGASSMSSVPPQEQESTAPASLVPSLALLLSVAVAVYSYHHQHY